MGCCGCSLYASTVTAGILTLLDCALYLTFDVLVILFMSVKSSSLTDDPEFGKFIAGFDKNNEDLNKDSTTVIILIGIKVGLRSVWLISAILLLIGNAREYRKFINVWKYLTISRIIYTIATSIYALISFVSSIKDLFDSGHKWSNSYDKVANFVVLMDFLELGPIWLIILIALAIYVHQRGLEINTKKRQNVNLWSNSGNHYSNGSARNGNSSLAHPVSLTQEPNPFTIAGENNSAVTENNNSEPMSHAVGNGHAMPNTSSEPTSSLDAAIILRPNTNDPPLKPILEINGVISIPRVTLNQSKTIPSQFDAHHHNKRYVSSLAKRSSYFEFERDENKVPRRTHSYNLAQTSGQKSYSYDNKGFDKKSEKDIYKPVLIKRASYRRSQNQ